MNPANTSVIAIAVCGVVLCGAGLFALGSMLRWSDRLAKREAELYAIDATQVRADSLAILADLIGSVRHERARMALEKLRAPAGRAFLDGEIRALALVVAYLALVESYLPAGFDPMGPREPTQ